MKRLDRCVVCLTRSPGQNGPLAKRVAAAGAETVEMPLIEIVPVDSESAMVPIRSLAHYEALIVTSANAVRVFSTLADPVDRSWREKPWYAIGRATADALQELGVDARLEPGVQDAEGFSGWLAEVLAAPQRLLFIQGVRARTVVPERLAAVGHQVDRCVCYDTKEHIVPDGVWTQLAQADTVLIPLFSPSAVNSLLGQRPDISTAWPEAWQIIAIGKTTASACAEAGLPVAVTARTPTVESVLDAIANLLCSHHKTDPIQEGNQHD